MKFVCNRQNHTGMHTHAHAPPPHPHPTPRSTSEQSKGCARGYNPQQEHTKNFFLQSRLFFAYSHLSVHFAPALLNTHKPMTQQSLSGLTMLTKHGFGSRQGNKLTCNSPQSVLSRSLSHHGRFIGLKTGYDAENKVLAGNKVQG